MSYKSNFQTRYNIGKQSEEEVLIIIKEYFNDAIELTNNKLDKFDFKGTKYKYELKTRTNKYKQYHFL